MRTLATLSVILLLAFSSCTIEDIDDAFVEVEYTDMHIFPEYDPFSNVINKHYIDFGIRNSGDVTAYDVIVLINIYTASGAHIIEEIYYAELYDQEYLEDVYSVTLINDYIDDYYFEVSWE